MSYAPKRTVGVFRRGVLAARRHGAFAMAEDGDGRPGGSSGSPRREPGPVIPRIPRPRPASE
jgi:hypothetical protein